MEDHCRALWTVARSGKVGETYNIGGNNEWKNIDIVTRISELLAAELGREPRDFTRLITFVADRPGHDLRYAIDAAKIKGELGWEPAETFETGLKKTVRWYLEHRQWVESVKSGDYKKWIDQQYGDRSAAN